MKLRKSQLFTLCLVVIAVLIHIYSNDSTRVENQYSTGIYPVVGSFLRYLFGWLPFSFGDIIYGLAILWLIWKLATGIKALFKRRPPLSPPKGEDMEKIKVKIGMSIQLRRLTRGLMKTIRMFLVIYILFNLLWGINYNRAGIAQQLDLKMEAYGAQELKFINGLLVEKVNASKQALVTAKAAYPTKQELFSKVELAYAKAETVYPFLDYKPVSLKPSVWSWVGNYMGFTGYYNPFTGEAQVNTLVPKFLLPFTTCHEVAHQLGYAKENEANFVAYLAAMESADTLLHYSVYLDLFMYSNRNLFASDSIEAKIFREQLIPAVNDDLKEWKSFNKKYRNPLEPAFRWIYGVYLEQNQQPSGVFSYDEVTAFIIAYYSKYRKI